MTILVFDLKVRFLFSPPLGRPFLRIIYRWMGWDGWMDGISKVSFKFLYSLWVYRTCIYLFIFIFKNCHQHTNVFVNFMSSLGSWSKNSKLKQVGAISFFRSESSVFILNTTCVAFYAKKSTFLVFCDYSFLRRILLRILLKILIKVLLRVLRMIKYISTYTCNTIKKTAAKSMAKGSEANKVPSEVRLIKYVSTY